MVAQEIKRYTKGAANLAFKHQTVLKVVEDFIFKRLKRDVEGCYDESSVRSNVFSDKVKSIQQLPLTKVLDFLEIKSVFRLQKDNLEQFSYGSAVNELNKLQFTAGPAQKLLLVVQATAWMKLAVLEFHKTQVELASMDDELPILILIASRVDPSTQIDRELSIMSDYLRLRDDWDFEEKHHRNLSVD